MVMKSQPALSRPLLHHLILLLLHPCLPLMMKPELASTSTLCPTSRLFLLHDPSTKSLPALRSMPHLRCLLHVQMNWFIHGWRPIVKTPLVSITTCCWSVKQIFYLETTWTIIIEQCLYYGCSLRWKLSLLCMHIQTSELFDFYDRTSKQYEELFDGLPPWFPSSASPCATLPIIPWCWCPFFS